MRFGRIPVKSTDHLDMLNSLRELYEVSSIAEQNIFADTVSLILGNLDISVKEIQMALHASAGLMTDNEIVKAGIIEGGVVQKTKKAGLSYGLEPCGYTCTLDSSYGYFPGGVIDPVDKPQFVSAVMGDEYVLPSKYTIQVATREILNMPDDVAGFINLKSTYTRHGLQALVAAIEPGYHGVIVFSLHNTNNKQGIVIRPNTGIIQISFFRLAQKPGNTYMGDYQGTYRG